MISTLPHSSPTGIVLEQHLSVRGASQHSGYSQQYLRRLLRNGRLVGATGAQTRNMPTLAVSRSLENQRSGHQRLSAGPQVWSVCCPVAPVPHA